MTVPAPPAPPALHTYSFRRPSVTALPKLNQHEPRCMAPLYRSAGLYKMAKCTCYLNPNLPSSYFTRMFLSDEVDGVWSAYFGLFVEQMPGDQLNYSSEDILRESWAHLALKFGLPYDLLLELVEAEHSGLFDRLEASICETPGSYAVLFAGIIEEPVVGSPDDPAGRIWVTPLVMASERPIAIADLERRATDTATQVLAAVVAAAAKALDEAPDARNETKTEPDDAIGTNGAAAPGYPGPYVPQLPAPAAVGTPAVFAARIAPPPDRAP